MDGGARDGGAAGPADLPAATFLVDVAQDLYVGDDLHHGVGGAELLLLPDGAGGGAEVVERVAAVEALHLAEDLNLPESFGGLLLQVDLDVLVVDGSDLWVGDVELEVGGVGLADDDSISHCYISLRLRRVPWTSTPACSRRRTMKGSYLVV